MSTASLPPSPRIDIRLPSGLLLRDAAAMLVAKFALWPWEVYDGVPLSDPDVITAEDVNASFQIGARTSVKHADYRTCIDGVRARLSGLLRTIPRNVRLEQPDLDLAAIRTPIIDLFDSMTAIPGMKLANASKIVHRHRPALLPILDSMIDRYYWFSVSLRDEPLFLRLQRMSWGEYAFTLIDQLRQDLLFIEPQLVEVRRAVANTTFAGASNLRLLESLIWYYYAGR